jgi:hypothetical protein
VLSIAIPRTPFLGSAAIRAGRLTRAELRGPRVRRLLQGVYVAADVAVTHELRCAAASLVLPPTATITGRSAATLCGIPLAADFDPVEALVPDAARVFRNSGLRVRRTEVVAAERTDWHGIGLATPMRLALDLLLGRALPDATADLDAVLRAGLVQREQLRRMLAERHDRGIRVARRAEALADPRAESRPESRLRVVLVEAGLVPVPQFWISDADGAFARVDLAFPEQRVAVEYDGEWRRGEQWALNRDRGRLNRLHAAGWSVVFVTRRMMYDTREAVTAVRIAIAPRD